MYVCICVYIYIYIYIYTHALHSARGGVQWKQGVVVHTI